MCPLFLINLVWMPLGHFLIDDFFFFFVEREREIVYENSSFIILAQLKESRKKYFPNFKEFELNNARDTNYRHL